MDSTACISKMQVHEAVALQAKQSPTAVAITEIENQSQRAVQYTFKQLDEDSNRIARMLIERCGVQGASDTPIGVCMDGYRSVP